MDFYYIFDFNKKAFKLFLEDISWEIGYFFKHSIMGTYRSFIRATYYRLKLGFNPADTWSLDVSIAQYILPRLKYLKKHLHGHPPTLTFRQWQREIDKMIAAFALISNETYYHSSIFGKDQSYKIIEMGLNSFRKYYFHLWD